MDLPRSVQRSLYATFILSYLLTIVVMHHGGSGASYSAVPYDVTGYNFLSLKIPFSQTVFLVVGVAYLVSIGVCAALLLRRAAPRLLGPVAALVASQALWFSIPVALRAWNVHTGLDPIDADPKYYFIWIGVAHAVQYLWVTSYYYKATPRWNGGTRYIAKVTLVGALVWTVPGLIFAPDVLGRVPFSAGLAALIAAAVNLQHFILDGAIWKLRSGPVARVLIRSGTEDAAAPSRPSWRPHLVKAVGVVCIAVIVVDTWETHFGVRRALALEQLARVERAIDRINWIGRDNPNFRLAIGDQWLRVDERDRALAHFERALELEPSARSWRALGVVHARNERWELASEAYEEALAFAPDDAGLHHAAGAAWIESGEPERARSALERAVELEPKSWETRKLLRGLEREAGNGDTSE